MGNLFNLFSISMGNACCNGGNRQDGANYVKANVGVVGNLDDPEEIYHGPSPNDAIRVVNQIERVRQAHQELLNVGYNPTYKDYEMFGENYGPYKNIHENAIFYGQFSGGLRHGLGIIVDNDNSIYEGEWANDKIEGYGAKITPERDYFMGNFVNGEPHGLVQLVQNDGYSYQGEWSSGYKHGPAKEELPDGSEFEGQFENNERQGNGKAIWADKSVYEGDWSAGRIHGVGRFGWPDGRRYDGQYLNGNKHGAGQFRDANGSIYDGDWKDGKQHGFGKIVDTVGGVHHSGNWVMGSKVSQSTL